MGRNQREYVLRQQLKAIKEELGEIDEAGGDLDEFREKIVDGQDAARGREGRAQAARAAQGDAAVVGRVHGHAHLPRVAGGAALVDLDRGQARHPGGAQHPQRRPLRPREGEEAHPRVPGGAQAQERQEGPDPLPGRAARRRQDVARPVDRARDRAQVHPHLAGRRARRGRDPRPPAHLRRLAAGPHHPGHEEGRVEQPGVHARRDRQARARLPRRPGGGAARGARPRAELHLLGPLPRGPVRPVEGDVRRDGEHPRPDPAGAARPPRGARAARLHARGEAQHLASSSSSRSSSRSTASTSEQADVRRRRGRRGHRQLHARGRRAQPRARDRQRHPRGRGAGGRGQGASRTSGSRTNASPSSSGRQKYMLRGGGADRGAGRGHRAWPGRRSAATSCSSRRPR